ncbi:MAG TPA: hypothetical protein VE732_01955 [Nitrososphaera sp.]|nr:hypothetical protein [Nitrososphaera sp.]
MIVGFITCILFYSACGPKTPDGCDEARAFFNLPSGEQLPEFRNLSAEKQLEYVICDYRYTHPFSVTFVRILAQRGDEVIPLLAEKIKTERDANNLEAVIYVLEIMFKDGTVKNKGTALQQIRQATVEMKCDSSKERCNERWKDIDRILASQ